MALISIAKLLLILCGLTALLYTRRAPGTASPFANIWTPWAVLALISALALSLWWSIAPQDTALGALAKYGKLLTIPLMVFLIRDRREAMYALGAFTLAQLFLLASSWMLFVQWPVPWATSNMALSQYSVFSSYLDQSIISAVFAAFCWHFRGLFPGRFGRHLAVLVALAALALVFFVMQGRSGHVVAIALLSVAIMWELPKRYRAAVVLLPVVLVVGLAASSGKLRDRLSLIQIEVKAYSAQQEQVTSSGQRLNYWHQSLQSISQNPPVGTGVGSWGLEYNRLQREQNPVHQDAAGGKGNPHQEYLLLGVQLGIPGILLLLGLMLALLRDSTQLSGQYARAMQSALLALAIACLLNSSIYDAQIGDFFCILTGLLLAAGLANNSAPALTNAQPAPAT